jgi:predicted methyltransferase
MTCLYLVTDPSYLSIIRRDTSPAASSAAGFLFGAPRARTRDDAYSKTVFDPEPRRRTERFIPPFRKPQ